LDLEDSEIPSVSGSTYWVTVNALNSTQYGNILITDPVVQQAVVTQDSQRTASQLNIIKNLTSIISAQAALFGASVKNIVFSSTQQPLPQLYATISVSAIVSQVMAFLSPDIETIFLTSSSSRTAQQQALYDQIIIFIINYVRHDLAKEKNDI
jgi:hypothetical protein